MGQVDRVKVAKFGGTSVANAAQLRKVAAIVAADDARKIVVPSAPGKEHKDDTKITDLLYLAHELASKKQSIDSVWANIEKRFLDIIADLGISCDLQPALDEAKANIEKGASVEYAASRGEALNGRIVAALINAEYIDAAEIIRFDKNKRFDDISYQLIADRCSAGKHYVIPGFYGAQEDGTVCTFSRGGSDVTGAVAAHAVNASLYENWTDVSGFLMTDPRIVAEAQVIKEITYRELRELSYMGASVLHEEAVFPVNDKEIPINIRNTNDPEAPGTLIVADRDPGAQVVTGIAGRSGFTVLLIEKALMNNEVGFGRRVLDVFERLGISYEHTPSGIDSMSVVVSDDQLNGKLDQILEDLQTVHPDRINVIDKMSLIATVGKGMNRQIGTAAKLFNALADAKVNIRMIDQGSSEQNIIVGVEEADLSTAIKAIYAAFIH